ncbi:hypothetical protein TNCV_3724351 [Trichonephila clavipes]|nr:hypothetical protein TNCV_3724351 [Trichonephila clavipes]
MLDHLEDNIRRVIADIWPQMLEKVIENWTSRLDYIRASRGSPMPEIIFKMLCHTHRLTFSRLLLNHFRFFVYLILRSSPLSDLSCAWTVLMLDVPNNDSIKQTCERTKNLRTDQLYEIIKNNKQAMNALLQMK